MISIRLPNLSDRVGRPVCAMVETPSWLDDRDLPRPPADAVLIMVDRPIALVMAEMPAEISASAWNAWVDRTLASCISMPAMTVEELQITGLDRELLWNALQRLWLWIGEHDRGKCPAPKVTPAGDLCEHFSFMPNKVLCSVVTTVAIRLKVPPHELLKWRIDDLMLSFRMLQGAEPEQTLEDFGG